MLVSESYAQQTGLNSQPARTSTILDLNVENLPVGQKKGFLLPRLQLQNRLDVQTIPSPSKGIWIYNMRQEGQGEQLVKSLYNYIWTGTLWDYFPSREDVMALQSPDEYSISSKTNFNIPHINNFNAGQLVAIPWQAADISIANDQLISLDNATAFRILKTGLFEFSGTINYTPNIPQASSSAAVVLALQSSNNAGLTWTSISAIQQVFGYGEVNTVQSIPFPANLFRLQAGQLIRLVLIKSTGVNHGVNAGITVPYSADIKKTFRISYISP